MLRWSEVVPLVREVLARHSTRLGFGTPARAMWRYRPQFVDVVWFEGCRDHVAVELGSTPRVGGVRDPKPFDCRFRAFPAGDLGVDGTPLLYADDVETQHAAFEELAPQLFGAAERWFARFESVASARAALDSGIHMPRRGSPAYEAILAELAAVEGRVHA